MPKVPHPRHQRISPGDHEESRGTSRGGAPEWVVLKDDDLEPLGILEARRNTHLISTGQPIPDHADPDILKDSIAAETLDNPAPESIPIQEHTSDGHTHDERTNNFGRKPGDGSHDLPGRVADDY